MPKERDREQIAYQFLSTSFGLTPAEARIAYGIARGERLATIAETSGIALTTAKTQLRAVFIKTGTHRQAELAILLARMGKVFL
jgi:DNA-binding CsgD family transcriptional regulator